MDDPKLILLQPKQMKETLKAALANGINSIM